MVVFRAMHSLNSGLVAYSVAYSIACLSSGFDYVASYVGRRGVAVSMGMYEYEYKHEYEYEYKLCTQLQSDAFN